jgi:AcrR family transcriptional regulator
MYPRQVPRTAPAAVRLALIERAAAMLAAREPVTLRGLVAGTGVSTMAVYTHFDGMPGLWRAVRQEGFVRMLARFDAVPRTADAVRDLAALGASYQAHAREQPDLYRAMFDDSYGLDDAVVPDATFDALVEAAARAVADGRFDAACVPRDLATRYWAFHHGLAMLRLGLVLDAETLPGHAQALSIALCTAAGDDPDRCRASVLAGWAGG